MSVEPEAAAAAALATAAALAALTAALRAAAAARVAGGASKFARFVCNAYGGPYLAAKVHGSQSAAY